MTRVTTTRLRWRRRAARAAAGAAAAALLLLAPAHTATADTTPTPSPTGDSSSGDVAEAGTSFRTAVPFRPGQQAHADASSGDYLYWVFPADTGQRATVHAHITYPDSSPARTKPVTWQVDVFDGLRRRQACQYGTQTRVAPAGSGTTVHLACVLRTVRAWAEPWANDPLPGSYYVRVTATQAARADQGVPVNVRVETEIHDTTGAGAGGGRLSTPLTTNTGNTNTNSNSDENNSGSGNDENNSNSSDGSGSSGGGAATAHNNDHDNNDDGGGGRDTDESGPDTDSPTGNDQDTGPQAQRGAAPAPDGGWSTNRWNDRWLFTAGGGILAALTGISGYALTRPRRSPHPPTHT